MDGEKLLEHTDDNNRNDDDDDDDHDVVWTKSDPRNNEHDMASNKVPEVVLPAKLQNKNRFDVRKLVTATLSASFCCLGFTYSMLGPTLIALSNQVGGASVGEMGSVFAARSLGYLIGSIGGGKLVDLVKNPRWLLVLVMIVVACGGGAVPYCDRVEILAVVLMMHGLAMGTLDTIGNVLAIRTWKEEVGTHLQIIHFAFALGAFVAPLSAREILIEDAAKAGGDSCMFEAFDNITPPTETVETDHTISVAWTWWIGSIACSIVALFWFGLTLVEMDLEPPSSGADNNSSSEVIGLHGIKRFQRHIVVSIMGFLCMYVGSEVAYGGLAYTFSIESCMLEVAAAADVTASYWGSFALGRLIAIPVSTVLNPALILTGSLSIASTAVAIEAFFPSEVWAIWVGTFLYGIGLAASFPTAFTILSDQVDVTGKVATLTVVAAAFGEMVLPWIVANMMDSLGSRAFMGGMVMCTALSVVTFVWFWYICKRRRDLHWQEMTRRALESQDVDTDSEGDGMSEIRPALTSPDLELTQRKK